MKTVSLELTDKEFDLVKEGFYISYYSGYEINMRMRLKENEDKRDRYYPAEETAVKLINKLGTALRKIS